MNGMEVISSQALWKDYDRNLPLNQSVVSVKETSEAVETRLYFSGAASPDGVTRIFARLVRPKAEGRLPVVIVFGDLYDDVDRMAFDCAPGAAVLYVDYSGRKQSERFTIYPESMRYAESFYRPDTLNALPAGPKQTCWYVWATVFLRAVTFVESRIDLDSRSIVAAGYGAGGASVWKAAAAMSVKCGVIVNEYGAKLDDTAFKAALDSVSYAGRVTVPVLSVCCSNASGQTLDEISETVSVCPHCLLNVRPRAFRGVDFRQAQTIRLFLQAVMRGDPLPARPKLNARGSEGALYYETTLDSPATEARLYASNSVQAPGLRNWQVTPMEGLGDGQYIARVAVADSDAPVWAFAWAAYENGLTLCSELVEVSPAALSLNNAERSKSRLIYDGDMGVDDWIAGDGDDALVAEGPFGIKGVSASGALSTFKLSDRTFSGEQGYILQMLAYSDVDQTITVNAVTKTGEVYFALRELKRGDDWVKLSFDLSDFKSSEGALDNWQRVAAVSLTFGGRVIVSNMLWV